MEKWEYLVVSKAFISGNEAESLKRLLDQYGAQGWELTCVYGHAHYFKRRKA